MGRPLSTPPRDLVHSEWAPRNFHAGRPEKSSRAPYGVDPEPGEEQRSVKGVSDGMWLGSPSTGMMAPYRQRAPTMTPRSTAGEGQSRRLAGPGLPPPDAKEQVPIPSSVRIYQERYQSPRRALHEASSPKDQASHRPMFGKRLDQGSHLGGGAAAVLSPESSPRRIFAITKGRPAHDTISTALRTMHGGNPALTQQDVDPAPRPRTPAGAAAARLKALLSLDERSPTGHAGRRLADKLRLGDDQRKALSFRSRSKAQAGTHELHTERLPAPQRAQLDDKAVTSSFVDAHRSCALNSLRGQGCPDLLSPRGLPAALTM